MAYWKHEDIKTPKAVKGFLGLANWYSISIHKYADYAAPLMEALCGKYQCEPIPPDKKGTLDGNGKPVKKKKVKLLPKQTKIAWNTGMIKGFEKLKADIVRNAELYFSDLSGSWIIESDASDYAVGGILKQKQPDGRDMPVAHFSRKLQGSRQGYKPLGQMGWTVSEKETYTLLCCLLKFQSRIRFNGFVIRTDNKSIVQWYKEDLCTISSRVRTPG